MNTTNGKLEKKIFIKGRIITQSGLHIGGSNLRYSIGGTDATVVRNPLNNEPYIPGSSLKGKMRSLLEKSEGKFTKGAVPHGPYTGDVTDPICKVFGFTPNDIDKSSHKDESLSSVGRIIVRDSPLSIKSVEKLERAINTDMPFTEVKTEVVIDRITSAATPRQIERVPAGVTFDMTLILNIYKGDDQANILKTVYKGLRMVKDDYLGGKGSRGSGEVNIVLDEVYAKTVNDYQTNELPDHNKEESTEKEIIVIPEELMCGSDVPGIGGK